ncbi:MAG: LysR family transcriptional regulator [Polaromonas sp.]|nr:LysR family transcriptional regulator [Polaromonas sp.]
MNITLDQLKAFDQVVKLGTFHAAGVALHITQPSVSTRIRELEAALNTKLFIRNGPRIRLTAEGRALMAYAGRMLETTDAIAARFHTRNALNSVLRIGMNESFALISFVDLMKRLELYYPDIQTSVFLGNTGTLSEMLNARQLEIGIVSEPVVGSGVTKLYLGENEFGWFAPYGASFANDELTPAALADHHLLLSGPTGLLYANACQWFTRTGISPARISTCNNIWITVQLVAQGMGVGLLPVRVVQPEVDARRICRLNVKPEVPSHGVYLCYQTSEFRSEIEMLVELVNDLIRKHALFVTGKGARSPKM